MNTFETIGYGQLLVYELGMTTEDIERLIRDNDLSGLRIFDPIGTIGDLSFLKNCKFLDCLNLTLSRNPQNLDFLSELTSLRYLVISHFGNPLIDLSYCTNLEYLAITWSKKVVGLNHLNKLSDLCLISFKEPDLSKIRLLHNLRRLRIKTGSVKTLSGIEQLNALIDVDFGNCRNLMAISAINGLLRLEKAEFSTCTKVQDWHLLSDLPSLKELTLYNCKNIPSIQFITYFPKLEFLALLGNTDVGDCNLSYATRIPYVLGASYGHYKPPIPSPNDNR